MDDKSLAGYLNQMVSGEKEDNAQEQDDGLATSLKAVAGASSGAVEEEIGAFLEGRGTLLETAQTALTRGGSSAASDVAELLEKNFGLSPAIARIIGQLVVKLAPGIKKKKTAKKPKKPSASTKPAAKKKPKKDTAAKAKPKKKPAAKKETAKKPRKKTTAKRSEAVKA